MKQLPLLTSFSRYEQSYQSSNNLAALEIMAAIYKMRGVFLNAYINGDESVVKDVLQVDFQLGAALEKAITIDPRILNASEDIPLITYDIESHPVDFKIESGNRSSVAHARDIQWDANMDYMNDVYEAYNKSKPKGPLTKDKLSKLPKEFHDTDFGSVKSFNLIIEKAKKDSDEQDIVHLIEKESAVIAISSPKIGGVRKEIRPGILLHTKGPGLEQGVDQLYFLTSREETKYRVLAGADLLQQAKISIIYGEHDNTFLDTEKVQLNAIKKIVKPYIV